MKSRGTVVPSAIALSIYVALALPSASCVASRTAASLSPKDALGLRPMSSQGLVVAETDRVGIGCRPAYRRGSSWTTLAVSPSQRISDLFVRASSHAAMGLGWEHAKVYRLSADYGSVTYRYAVWHDPADYDNTAVGRPSCDNLLSARAFPVAERLGAGTTEAPCARAPRTTQPLSPQIPSGMWRDRTGMGP
jgi:hypothetical protein